MASAMGRVGCIAQGHSGPQRAAHLCTCRWHLRQCWYPARSAAAVSRLTPAHALLRPSSCPLPRPERPSTLRYDWKRSNKLRSAVGQAGYAAVSTRQMSCRATQVSGFVFFSNQHPWRSNRRWPKTKTFLQGSPGAKVLCGCASPAHHPAPTSHHFWPRPRTRSFLPRLSQHLRLLAVARGPRVPLRTASHLHRHHRQWTRLPTTPSSPMAAPRRPPPRPWGSCSASAWSSHFARRKPLWYVIARRLWGLLARRPRAWVRRKASVTAPPAARSHSPPPRVVGGAGMSPTACTRA